MPRRTEPLLKRSNALRPTCHEQRRILVLGQDTPNSICDLTQVNVFGATLYEVSVDANGGKRFSAFRR